MLRQGIVNVHIMAVYSEVEEHNTLSEIRCIPHCGRTKDPLEDIKSSVTWCSLSIHINMSVSYYTLL